jgi:hypothetical protein
MEEIPSICTLKDFIPRELAERLNTVSCYAIHDEESKEDNMSASKKKIRRKLILRQILVAAWLRSRSLMMTCYLVQCLPIDHCLWLAMYKSKE